MFEPELCPSLPDVEALWDGELDAERTVAVRLHLSGCDQCAAELRQLEAYSGLLREADPALALAPVACQRVRQQLLARVAEELRAERVGEPARPWRRWFGARTFLVFVPALAASLVIFSRARVWFPRTVEVRVNREASQVAPTAGGGAAAGPARPKGIVRSAPRNRPLASDKTTPPSRPQPPRSRLAQVLEPEARERVVAAHPVSAVVSSEQRVKPRAEAREAPQERLVVDLNGSADSGNELPTRVSLFARGSTDGAEATVIVVRHYAEESNP